MIDIFLTPLSSKSPSVTEWHFPIADLWIADFIFPPVQASRLSPSKCKRPAYIPLARHSNKIFSTYLQYPLSQLKIMRKRQRDADTGVGSSETEPARRINWNKYVQESDKQ
jgi:hypothetical protein